MDINDPVSKHVIEKFVTALELNGNITSSIRQAMYQAYHLGFADGECKQIARSIETLREIRL
jgi:hypothetical protein